MRYHNGIYRDCKWCRGKGCLACPAEADKEYKRQFPDGPKPILTIPTEDFDRFAISEATGGPSIEDAHGNLGRLCEFVFEAVRAEGRTASGEEKEANDQAQRPTGARENQTERL